MSRLPGWVAGMTRSCVHVLAAGVLAFAGALAAQSASEGNSRDKLWNIVTTCVGAEDAGYCQRCNAPRADSACQHSRRCEDTTEVWDKTSEYVAIRDVKMCSCPAGFVHGLAIPRTKVKGIEASPLPHGIWAFAWAVAQGKIADDSTIALVVNSARGRSQDQLHVHLVRLREDARRNFTGRMASVLRLDDVWNAVSQLAANQPPLKDYNVLVASDLKGGFEVLVENNDKSLERTYTQRTCR
jgi:CDP-diacylglycerol pyrophosphatase